MIRLIRWLLTSGIRYRYEFVRAILRLPLLLLPIPPQVRNQVAGALAIALWFFLLLVSVAVSDSPWRAEWLVIGAAAPVIVGVVRMAGRRPILRRPARAR
ncbi:hypothetical protein MN0502_17100 [Arthrobacter sp. MN05-02]|nr:hypothetical protein MN0502_17100 [Arthrobacter sp. MN05-02]